MNPGHQQGPAERRSEERVDVQRDAVLEVKTPTWAKLAKPFPGFTSNLTMHGMKVLMPEFSAVQYQTWRNHLDGDESIRVSVRLAASPDIEFEGDIAWTSFDSSDGAARGMCTVGVLLGVPDEKQTRAIRRILADRERDSLALEPPENAE